MSIQEIRLKEIRLNYEKLINNIKTKCLSLDINFDDITIVAISKTFPASDIICLNELGHNDIGENKVQELIQKYNDIRDTYPGSVKLKWHLVGHLQTNKVKYITDIVHLIHSVDSVKLAAEIQKQLTKTETGRDKIINVLIQVNTSREPQKSGVEIGDTGKLCKEISLFENIRIKGLMTIGMFTDNENIIRENFRTLNNLFQELKSIHTDFKYLSMGMTSDYDIALEEGANMLRIGSAIFGERN